MAMDATCEVRVRFSCCIRLFTRKDADLGNLGLSLVSCSVLVCAAALQRFPRHDLCDHVVIFDFSSGKGVGWISLVTLLPVARVGGGSQRKPSL